jgi:hypothetical protein
MLDNTPMSPPGAEDSNFELDMDIENLTGNLSQLSMEGDLLPQLLERRQISGREALWEAPEDPDVPGLHPMGDEEDDGDEEDVEMQREWMLQEDADTYGVFGEKSELTADEILQGQFISEAVRNCGRPVIFGSLIFTVL